MILTILVFVLVLGALIFVHEFGHFITAKRAGLTVEEFGFGFPPRLFGVKRGGTIYSINWIPFGGFVKILGEGGEDSDKKESFASRPIGVRAIVIAAGVIMNFILAFVLLWIVNMAGTTTAIDEETTLPPSARVSEPSVSVTQVVADSPAEQAGIRPGDRIALVDGQVITEEAQVVDIISARGGQKTPFELTRGKTTLSITATPRADPPEGQGPLGVGLVKTATVSFPWYSAFWQAGRQTVYITGQIFVVFGAVIKQLLTQGSVAADVAGPIGIAVVTGQVLDLGLVPLLQFAALLSINLGIINALPFPALDGGRLLFLGIEKVRRKKISRKVENVVHTVGFGLLLVLIVAITARDFIRFDVIDRIQNLF